MSLVRAVTMSAALLAAAHAAAAQSQPTKFTIRVENISTGRGLKLSNGKAAPFVSAPVLWAVHGGSSNPLFAGGQPDAGKGLETLAETGNPGPLLKSVEGEGYRERRRRRSAGRLHRARADHPGQGYRFEVSAAPGQSLSMAWMFGQSNDLFYANDRPIALFDGSGKPGGAT